MSLTVEVAHSGITLFKLLSSALISSLAMKNNTSTFISSKFLHQVDIEIKNEVSTLLLSALDALKTTNQGTARRQGDGGKVTIILSPFLA